MLRRSHLVTPPTVPMPGREQSVSANRTNESPANFPPCRKIASHVPLLALSCMRLSIMWRQAIAIWIYLAIRKSLAGWPALSYLCARAPHFRCS